MCLTRWEQQAGPTLNWFKSILLWDINFNPGGQRENSGEKSCESSWQPHHKVMVAFALINIVMEIISGTVFWAGSPHVVRPSTQSLARWRADWETRWPINELGLGASNCVCLSSQGNEKFVAKDNVGALKLYTESVICAPEVGPELSLAFGNRFDTLVISVWWLFNISRSAALFHLGHYQAASDDIKLALEHKYPK